MKHSILILSVFFATIFSGIANKAQAQHHENVKVVVGSRPAHPVVARQAHAPYAGSPRWGATVKVVPQGAVTYRHNNAPYYAHHGAYYAPHHEGFVVGRPAFGLHVNILPTGYRTINVGPHSYYYYYGTYYQPYGNGQYSVVSPPIGAIVDALPEGYTVENINGTEYYVFDGVYYAEVDAPEYPGGVGYEVVRI